MERGLQSTASAALFALAESFFDELVRRKTDFHDK